MSCQFESIAPGEAASPATISIRRTTLLPPAPFASALEAPPSKRRSRRPLAWSRPSPYSC